MSTEKKKAREKEQKREQIVVELRYYVKTSIEDYNFNKQVQEGFICQC